MRSIALSGMFRSGTTLLSRILSAHPQALVVADPAIYFFKAYRDHHLAAAGWPIDPERPTPDWFLDARQPVLRTILSADFSESMGEDVQRRVRHDIRRWKAAQHPRLADRIDEVRGHTFAEFYTSLVGLMAELYGGPSVTLAGTKFSWCEEFLPALMRAFPGLKVVLLVRDVRAIIASQDNKRGPGAGRRPLLFYIRHWRKSIALTESLLASELGPRACKVRYEDLVLAPVDSMERICATIDLPFDRRMLDSAYWESEGHQGGWQTNSSYRPDAPMGIDTRSLHQWQTRLPGPAQAVAGRYAGPELRQQGYAVPTDLDPHAWHTPGLEPIPDEVSDWLRDLPEAAYIRSVSGTAREYAAEELRLDALLDASLPSELVDRLFLDSAQWERLRTMRSSFAR